MFALDPDLHKFVVKESPFLAQIAIVTFLEGWNHQC